MEDIQNACARLQSYVGIELRLHHIIKAAPPRLPSGLPRELEHAFDPVGIVDAVQLTQLAYLALSNFGGLRCLVILERGLAPLHEICCLLKCQPGGVACLA